MQYQVTNVYKLNEISIVVVSDFRSKVVLLYSSSLGIKPKLCRYAPVCKLLNIFNIFTGKRC